MEGGWMKMLGYYPSRVGCTTKNMNKTVPSSVSNVQKLHFLITLPSGRTQHAGEE